MKFLYALILPLATWGLSIVQKRFVDNLPADSQTRTDLTVLLSRVKQLVEKMTDANPDNAAQLDALWREVVGTDMALSATARIDALVASLDDERLRKTILTLSRPGIDVFGLLSDDNKQDLDQIKERFTAFAANPDTHDLVLYSWIEPTLLAKGVPPFVVGVLLDSIADAIEGVFEKDDEAPAKMLSASDQAVVVHLRARSKDLTYIPPFAA